MLKLRIVSPENVVYNGEAESLKVPGMMGEFEILTCHRHCGLYHEGGL